MGSLIKIFSAIILRFLPISLSDIMYIWKKLLSHFYLRLYRRLNQGRLNHHEFVMQGEPENVGFISHPIEWQLETPQSELQLVKADDEIFFSGVSSKGECLVVSISRLCNHEAEAIIYLRLASGKTYKLECSADFQQSTGDQKIFSCGGLQLCTLQPMKRWRIYYSGYLKDISDDIVDVQEAVYVKFSFLWGASSDVYDSTFDLNDSLIVKSVSKADWKHVIPPIHKLFESLDFYAQAGVIFGTVCIDNVVEDHEMYLFGEKIRFLGNTLVCKEMEAMHTLGFLHENGTYLHFGETAAANIAEKIKYGFVVKPDGDLKTLKKLKLSSTAKDCDTTEIQLISGKMEAGRTYKLCGSVTQPVVQISNKNKILNVHEVKFHVNGKKGSGIQIKWKTRVPLERKISDIALPVKIPECVHPMVTAFCEDLCQLADVAGGKGSSLSTLTILSRELRLFSVPPGFVVTTLSYKHFISTDILEEIKVLEDVLYGNKDGDTKEVCKRVKDKIIATNFPNPVLDNIVRNLMKIFGDEYRSKTFAVRSSATGEDTEQMSAAGQMETYLGVTGLNQVLSAIKKCWASQFGFTAVQYKRRYGQCLNTPMAVVIQEMVACDKAGVIFTCDPVTGKSNRISIAASFGLGESVVSSAVDPDTIELIRGKNDELRMNTLTVGSKNKKIVLSDGGTRLEDLSENEKQECCLSTDEIFRLGDLAIKIEKYFRSKRDIEWGIQNDSIYVFQSRPVTSGTQETTFEIEHEFDAPLRLENDYFSVANAAEVLPGAIPPLSRDLFLSAFHIFERGNFEVETSTDVKTRYFLMGWFTFYSHLMFNVPDLFYKNHLRSKSALTKAAMASSFGVTLEDEEIFKVIEERYSDISKNISLKSLIKLAKVMLFYGKRLKEGKKHYQNYRIPVEKYHTSKDLFHALLRHCCDLSKAYLVHTYCSSRCALGNMLLLGILCQDKENLDNDAYTDFAKLITTGENVESADVPTSVQNLAFHISKSIEPDVFKSMKYEEALAWLTDTSSSIGRRFREFIEKHGHRGFRELDIYSPSWRADPEPLIQLLQSKVGNVSEEACSVGNPSVRKLINELKTPAGLLMKLKLLFWVPQCWKGVQGRESSKSLLVKGLDAWRAAYWHLAKLMVLEGRIPEEKILFFMTLEEIKELLNNRSPKLLARAYRRKMLFRQMDDYVFPDVIRGFPKPINTTGQDQEVTEENLCMKGLPVCQGIARGYLRVAVTLDEAACVKPGEILLTYATDVGWSPYFPNLAGVATELGGLISHGAVVSREYGLPCVVGLPGATRKFRTGDYVLLDGNKGILKKISSPD